MCLAVPMKLIKKEGDLGWVETGGVSQKVALTLVPEVKPGDYLIIHAGFAIGVVDEKEAQKTLALLQELTEDVG